MQGVTRGRWSRQETAPGSRPPPHLCWGKERGRGPKNTRGSDPLRRSSPPPNQRARPPNLPRPNAPLVTERPGKPHAPPCWRGRKKREGEVKHANGGPRGQKPPASANKGPKSPTDRGTKGRGGEHHPTKPNGGQEKRRRGKPGERAHRAAGATERKGVYLGAPSMCRGASTRRSPIGGQRVREPRN